MTDIERFDPKMRGKTAYEHLHRYGLSKDYVDGKTVLDLGSGEGYGTAILGENAQSIIGLELDVDSVRAASRKYGRERKISFQQGDCRSLPFSAESFDVVVAFEIIEHISEQDVVLAEISRVLKPGGVLIISTPNREVYNRYKAPNPFHVKEFEINEFNDFLNSHFVHVEILGQTMSLVSVVGYLQDTALSNEATYRGYTKTYSRLSRSTTISSGINIVAEPEYSIAFCSDEPIIHPVARTSLYWSQDDDLWSAHAKVMAWASNLHNEDEELRGQVRTLSSDIENLHRQSADYVQEISNLESSVAHAREHLLRRDEEIARLSEMTNKTNDLEDRLEVADRELDHLRIQSLSILLGQILEREISSNSFHEITEALTEAATEKVKQKEKIAQVSARLDHAESASVLLRSQINSTERHLLAREEALERARVDALELERRLLSNEKDSMNAHIRLEEATRSIITQAEMLESVVRELDFAKRELADNRAQAFEFAALLSQKENFISTQKQELSTLQLKLDDSTQQLQDMASTVEIGKRAVSELRDLNSRSEQMKKSRWVYDLCDRVQKEAAEAKRVVRIELGRDFGVRSSHYIKFRWRDFAILKRLRLFDAEWYAAQDPNISIEGAWSHFKRHGAKEGRDPHPFFNGTWFASRYPEQMTSTNALMSYLRSAKRSELSTHPLIDLDYYLAANQDVASSGIEPLEHYMEYGQSEGRSPSPLILCPWVERKWDGKFGHPFSLRDYLVDSTLWQFSTYPLFDAAYYLKTNSDLADNRGNPFIHYLIFGWREGRSPHALFDNDWYLQRNSDVLQARVNPLVHFVKHGAAEGRDPNPLFDIKFYVDANPDVASSGINPFVHYVIHGQHEARAFRRERSDEKIPGTLTAGGRKIVNLMKIAMNPEELTISSDANLSPCLNFPSSSEATWPPEPVDDYWLPQRLRDYILDRFGEDYLALNSYLFSVVAKYNAAPDEFLESSERKKITDRVIFLSMNRKMMSAGPLVASIIIPVFNNYMDTLVCIASLLESESSSHYEIIVADDCSTDATEREFSKIGGIVKYVRQASNLGFLANCNAAVGRAQGTIVIMLNNDTIILPSWLDNLIKPFSLREKVGLVGSKLLNWDGSLQEAGGIFWKDGSAWNFGRNQDAGKAEFNYLRETDYCSGASIAIPKSIWEEVGGFDSIYSPAYCEDSDLAFRIRDAGYQTLYQPHSELVHHEGRSHGRDLNSGVKAYQLKNQKTLLSRWAKTLEAEHYDNGRMLAHARDRSGAKPRILIIDHYVPQWEHDAGSRTMHHYIRMFVEKGFQVTFWPDNLWRDPEYTPRLQEMGVEIIFGPSYVNQFETWLNEDGRYFNYIFLSRPHIATKYLAASKRVGSKLLYYGHDLHFLRMQTQFDLEPSDGLLEQIREMEKQELTLCADVDVFFYPSQSEIDAVKMRIGDGGVGCTIPMNIFEEKELRDVKHFDLASRSKSKILFVGGFSHSPNVDGLKWFVNEVMPVLRQLGEYELWVVGSNPPEEIVTLESADTRILGRVTDDVLNQLYNECAVALAPLRFGGGVKGKVIEAMSKGVPLVTTSIGVQGISGARELVGIEDDATEFAREVWRSSRHDQAIYARVLNGLKFIEENYTVKAAVTRINNFIPELR